MHALTIRSRCSDSAGAGSVGEGWPLTSSTSPVRPSIRSTPDTDATAPSVIVTSETTTTRGGAWDQSSSSTMIAPYRPANT